ncbi:unnamed protein product [Ceutorhynchus assimilis]|uniref:BHLH domain-containing protein n=1 Tax=Ceutorhynchus assimilis TaxID=467358 RepID=A0A9N9MMZ8_9CUCU|nr:unnamed protein product [Ceutorhynchus assimilis]
MSKPEKNPRLKSKTRAWEQGRRDRLAVLFSKLWEALPNYDPSNKLSKPDILMTAESTIRRLDAELKSVLVTGQNKAETKSSATKEKAYSILIKKLEDRVKKLLLRNEQLSKCLSKAGIKAKSESGTAKRNKKPPKYANAISGEQQAEFLQKELEKENQAKVQKPKRKGTTLKQRKVSEKPKIKKTKKKLLSSSNCVFLVTQAMTQNSSCFILSKPSSKISPTVITNSLLVKTPIVSSNIKPSIFPTYPQLPSLGPGTLLFANGTMMPIVPTPRPLPVLPTIVANPISSQIPTLVVVTSKDTINSSVNTIVTSTKPCNSLPVLRPKLVNNTKTIQANKVPIPALTSKIVCRKAEVLDSQKKVSETTVQNNHKKLKTSKKIEKTSNETQKLDTQKNPDKNIPEVTQETSSNNKDACEIPAVEASTSFCATNDNRCKDILKPESSKIDHQEKTTADSTEKTDYQLETFANVVTKVANNSVASSKPTDINSIFSETCVNSSISNNNDTNPKNVQIPETSHTQTQSFAKQKTFEHNTNLQNDLKSLEMTELSNDIFASFQVAPGCQNPESTSPTAAFLLAFPLVSSGAKVTEVLGDENLESQAGTPNLLQIGTMDISKPTQNYSESFTPNLLNFDSFNFNNCGNFYNNNCSQQSAVTTSTKTFVNNSNINVNSSKNETLTNTQFNQNDIGKTKPSINKTGSTITNNYHTKELPLNINLNKNIPVSSVQTNLHNNLDLNNDIFSFKPNNENFMNSNKHSSTIKPYNNIPTYSTYKTCSSNQFMPNKNYPLVYTSASISNSFYSSFTTSDTVAGNFNSTNYNNYIQYGKTNHYNSNNSQTYQKNKFKATTQSKPINWMTSPAVTTSSYKPDYFLPPFTNSSNAYLNSGCNEQQDFNRKTSEIFPTYRNDTEENQFSWSPNKIPQFLDTANHNNSFVSSTLPTLVGDLALNNTPSKEKTRKKSTNCDNNQTSFLSVSQLVEQSQENAPAKIVSRRTSGNRSKTNTPKTNKRRLETTNKEIQQQNNFNISVATNLFNENNKRTNKNIPSSYSAEALIGNNQNPNNEKRSNFCHQNKSLVPGFFNDNIVPYFPPVDTQQDNSYMQSYQPTYQNNSYSANNFSASSYNFMPNNQEFIGENMFQNGNNKCNFTQKNIDKTQSYSCKKAKKRPLNDNVLPSFDIHFLSMPGAINSPILPDDFHTTYLPPTTLYSCKNPLYPKKTNTEGLSGSLIPPLPAISNKPVIGPQMSPLINSAGTSLTNFNLSTIFPEINKESNQFFPLKNGVSSEKIEKTQNNYSSICTGQQYTT